MHAMRNMAFPLIVAFSCAVLPAAASELPSCDRSKPVATWDMCRGKTKTETGSTYRGEFKDGAPHGAGAEAWDDGERYVGEYRAGLRHGKGEYSFPNGSKYIGDFEDGYYHGQGVHE